MDGTGKEYRIEGLASPEPPGSLLRRVLFPQGNSHTFLRLTSDAGDGLRRTLAELHFTARDKSGQFVQVSHKPINMMAVLAGYVGLENAFYKAVESVGLGHTIARLKGVETGDRHESDEGLEKFGHVSGTPTAMLAAWHRACKAALEINRANIPFTQLKARGERPANCQAGTKTVLRAMGDEFKNMTDAFKSQRGSDLTPLVPGLQTKLPDVAQIENITLTSLQSAQRVLSQQLFKTSRLLSDAKLEKPSVTAHRPSSMSQ